MDKQPARRHDGRPLRMCNCRPHFGCSRNWPATSQISPMIGCRESMFFPATMQIRRPSELGQEKMAEPSVPRKVTELTVMVALSFMTRRYRDAPARFDGHICAPHLKTHGFQLAAELGIFSDQDSVLLLQAAYMAFQGNDLLGRKWPCRNIRAVWHWGSRRGSGRATLNASSLAGFSQRSFNTWILVKRLPRNSGLFSDF